MNSSLLADLVRRHLDDQHSTLWGKFYDLGEQSDREEAARWLVTTIESIVGDRIL